MAYAHTDQFVVLFESFEGKLPKSNPLLFLTKPRSVRNDKEPYLLSLTPNSAVRFSSF